jgi:hypothetical protein
MNRPITKSMGFVNKPIATSQAAESLSCYSYNYNIWSPNIASSNVTGSHGLRTSTSSSNYDSETSPISTASTSPTSTTLAINSNNKSQIESMIGRPAPSSKRQLPSTKAQSELIHKCIEKNKKYGVNKVLCCSFCKNNGEPAYIYNSHSLKDSVGRITCPLLKIYKCPICGESGQNAHTITYCKQFKNSKRNNIINNLQ